MQASKGKKNLLLEHITKKAINRPDTCQNKNLALFLTLKNDIKETLAEGWSAKFIWETLQEEKKFFGSYNCFLNYIKKYIKDIQQNEEKESISQNISEHIQTKENNIVLKNKEENSAIKRFGYRTDKPPIDKLY